MWKTHYKYGTKIAQEKNKTTLFVKTGRFDNIDSAVIIIRSVSKAVFGFYLLAYTADDDC